MSAPSWNRSDTGWVVAIVATAVVLRLIYLIQLQASPYFAFEIMDAAIHDLWAKQMAAGERFSDTVYFRAPLYPWFLGWLYKLTGTNYLLVRGIQLLIGGAGCSLVYLIGRRLLHRTTAGIAGLVAASYWVLIFFDAELLIPVIAVPLDLLVVWTLLRVDEDPSAKRIGLAGIALGLAAIARPNVLLFAPLAAIWIWRGPGKALKPAIIFTLGVLLPILPVTARNVVVGGEPVLIASQAGVNLWIGNNPQSDGMHVYLPGLTTSTDDIYDGSAKLAEREAGRPLSPSEVSKHYSAKARGFIFGEPGKALGLFASKAAWFWSHREILNNKNLYVLAERYTPLLNWLPIGFWLVGPLGLAGLAAAIAGRTRWRWFPVWAFVLAYYASVVLFFVNARFRVPIVPLLILLGAFAVERALSKEWKQLLAPGIALLIGIGLAVRTPPGEEVLEALALEKLGAMLFVQGKAEEAEQLLLEASERAPDQARILYTLARFYRERGDEAGSVETWKKLLAIEPNHPEALSTLGALSLSAGNLDEAGDYLERAIAGPNATAGDWTNLAQLRLGQGRIDDAIAAFERGGSQVPSPAFDLLTQSLIRERRYGDALTWLERWTTQDAQNSAGWARLAMLRSSAPDAADRNCDGAMSAAGRAIEIKRDVESLSSLAAAQAECRQFDEAVATASQAMQLDLLDFLR